MSRKSTMVVIILVVVLGLLVGLKLANQPEQLNPSAPEQSNSALPENIEPSLPEPDNATLSAGEQLETALNEGQPVWVMFGTNNCPYCVKLKKIFDELKPEYEDQVVFIDVNLDIRENYDLGMEYQIRYVPVTYIYDKEGNVSFTEGGLLEKELLIKELDKVIEE